MPTRLYRHTGETAVRIPQDPAEPAIVEIVRPSRGTMIAASNEETIAALDAHPDFEFVEDIDKDESADASAKRAQREYEADEARKRAFARATPEEQMRMIADSKAERESEAAAAEAEA